MPPPEAWNTYPLYITKREHDHIDRLYVISKLSGVGVAACDSAVNIAHLEGKLEGLFEIIHRLADEAIEIAELKSKRTGS